MSLAQVQDFAAQARAEKLPSHGRIVAMWAGIEAAKVAGIAECPFKPEEIDLVAGFQAGIAIGINQRMAKAPTYLLTRRAERTYAALSVPREQDAEDIE